MDTVPTIGFPTMAIVFTSIALLRHGLMLRKNAAKRRGTWSASAMWRIKALSSLNLDMVCKDNRGVYKERLDDVNFDMMIHSRTHTQKKLTSCI